MNNYNFKLANCDTDSIMFCKPDQTSFTKEEQEKLLQEINNLFPEKIKWEHDGIFSKVVVVKTKNYLLYDGNKLKIKGSALKASTKCPALKQLIKDILQAVLDDKDNFKEIYDNYAKEILEIKDMSRWCSRVTITDKMLKNTRKNEVVKRDALIGSEYREGDRCYMFYKSDNTMSLLENFNGDYNIDRLLENLYTTMEVFSPIMDMSQFPNYKLKKNKSLLEELRRK